jgi:hypothetical protein
METTIVLSITLCVLLFLMMTLMVVYLALRVSSHWCTFPGPLVRRQYHQQARRNAITTFPSPPPSYAHVLQQPAPTQQASSQQTVQVHPHWIRTTHLDGTEDMFVELMAMPLYVHASGESVDTLPRCEVRTLPPRYPESSLSRPTETENV